MRTIETTLYQFDELDESAKDRARENFRESGYLDDIDQWNWNEAAESRKAFLDEFNAEFRHGRCGSECVRIDQDAHWHGKIGDLSYVRLWKYLSANHAECISKIGNCQFTGVCWDECLLDGIAEFMRKPYRTDFESLLYSCCEDLRIAVEREREYQCSDAAIDDSIRANEYEFTNQGEIV
jgi:hypothetical protein